MPDQTQRIEAGGKGIQFSGSNLAVTITAGRATLALDKKHKRKAPPTNERELLLAELRATTLVGRDDDLASLWDWMECDRPVSVRCLTGRGGSGKTRLGIEPSELPVLRSAQDRRSLLAQVMREAARFHPDAREVQPPTLGANPEFDRRLASDTIDNEPLYLVMAGIVAVSDGDAAALGHSRIGLAKRIAAKERERLERLARAWGADPDVVAHLAACVTLEGGCDRAAAFALVAAETDPIGRPAEKLVNLLSQALPGPAGTTIDAVRPNLIGEAFLLDELPADGRPVEEQGDVVERAWRRSGSKVAASLVRTVQDFAYVDPSSPSLGWLDRLVECTDEVGVLIELADELPDSTLALRERAALITGRVVELLRPIADDGATALLAAALSNLAVRLSDVGRREDALKTAQEAADLRRELAEARPDAFLPNLASSLNNLANRLSDVGRREDALKTAQEAADLYRKLAEARPDAFLSELAICLWVLSDRLEESGLADESVRTHDEALATLLEPFRQYSTAFGGRMAAMAREYLERCQRVGREADLTVLSPVAEILQSLKASAGTE